MVKWEIEVAVWGTRVKILCAEGWEPFAVSDGAEGHVVWLKRQVEDKPELSSKQNLESFLREEKLKAS